MRKGRARTIDAIALLLATTTILGGCVLSAIGEGPELERCESAEECEADESPCTEAACDRGACVQRAIADGLAPEQPPGDCEVVECVAGEAKRTLDEADPEDDDNDCTTDVCTESGTSHTPLADGEVCFFGSSQGSCSAGVCAVTCSDIDLSSCPGTENPCERVGCKNNTCTITPITGAPSGEVNDEPGDCQKPVCDEGVLGSAADDSDPVDDGNDCTLDVCVDGAPSSSLAVEGSTCSIDLETGVCLASGSCVECLEASDCADPSAQCIDNICSACQVDDDCPADSHCSAGKCFSCTDGVQNGGETGKDCGVPACGGCLGDACANDAACASDHCADGVCCNVACDETCFACRDDLNGSVSGYCSRVFGPSSDCAAATEVCCGEQGCIGIDEVCQ